MDKDTEGEVTVDGLPDRGQARPSMAIVSNRVKRKVVCLAITGLSSQHVVYKKSLCTFYTLPHTYYILGLIVSVNLSTALTKRKISKKDIQKDIQKDTIR